MKKMVVWPAYIDATKTRSEGRKISQHDAVKSPSLREIAYAASALRLEYEVEEGRAYPRSHWERSGRVLVEKAGKKTEILREIAAKIKEKRSKSATEREVEGERRKAKKKKKKEKRKKQ